MKKLALALSIVVLMCGCSSNVTSPVVVTIVPYLPPSIDQGQSLQFTATLANDTTNQGVVWSASGTGCSGSACGTFSNVTSHSATYNAPASVSAALMVTVTATSVASTIQNAVANFTVGQAPSIVTTNLPSATPNYIYYTALQGAGGIPPLKWSLASGTLPAGLMLNSAGNIIGTPTTGGTSTFTVKLTDSSGAPTGGLSTQQTLSLTVVPILTVTAGALPSGKVGVAYGATLSLSGGMPPYNWTIYTGDLPSGLVLQSNTGVITGTPTTQGTYSFAVEAFDSSPIQQSYISSSFTLTVNSSGPLVIRTTSLIDGTVGAPYAGQLVISGGTPPLDWTVTSGTLPSGLVLNAATGAITGTPTAPGTSSFGVTVSDTSTPQQTSTQTLSITINPTAPTCSSSGNNSVLVGQYAFSLRGFNGVGFLAVVGSFTADGNGNITAGEADTNGVLGAANGNLITTSSSYSVGSDDRGCATLATPFGTFFTRFAVGDLSAGVATQGRIIEFDNPGASAYIASGKIFQQNPSSFLFGLTGTYALRTAGWDTSTSGRVACVGILTAAKFQFSSQQRDCNDEGTVSNTNNTNTTFNTTFNTFSTADANGRGTGNLSVGQNTSAFTFYWVLNTYLLTVNSDPNPASSGELLLEQVPLATNGFNQSSFNTTVAAYASGLTPSGAGGEVSFATESANGVSAFTSQLSQDAAGTLQTSTPACTYSVVLIGRGTLSGGSCGAIPSLFYLTSLNNAYVLSTDSAIQLGSFEPQTTGLSLTSMAGTYVVGTSEVVNQSAQAEVGVLNLSNTGIVTSTMDTASIVNQTAGAAGTDTWTLKSNGTISTASSGGSTLGIAISGSNFAIVSNPTLTFPTLLIGQQ